MGQYKGEEIMKKVGYVLIIIALSTMSFLLIKKIEIKEEEKNNVEEYLDITSTKKIEKKKEDDVKKETSSSYREINYTAILEIPSINLKSGVVDNTKNFDSIRYAISVDNSSNYPDKNGNFILYAHSGNSNMSFFRNLNKVNINDRINVYFNGIKYKYKIIKKYDIEKSGTASVLSSKENKYITLITCNQERKGYQVVVVGILIEEVNY